MCEGKDESTATAIEGGEIDVAVVSRLSSCC